MWVIGFEGGPDAIVSWGAAALQVGDNLVKNTVSGRETTRDRFDALAVEGSVTKFTTPVEAPADILTYPAVVLRLLPTADIDTKPLRCAVKTYQTSGGTLFLFRSADELLDAAGQVVDSLTRAELTEGWPSERYFSIATTICPRHPEMNALWAHTKGTLARQVGRKAVLASDLDRYESLLEALDSAPQAVLTYNGGTASDHRLQTHAIADFSRCLDWAFGASANKIAERHGFLEEVERPEVQERLAASVDWVLRIDDPNPYRRIAKALTWLDLRRTLADGPSAAYDSLVKPDTDISLTVTHGDLRFSVSPAPRGGSLWFKKISRSEAQKQRVGSAMPYLRLTKGSLLAHEYEGLGWPDYFRRRLFGELDWVESAGKETARVLMRTQLPGYGFPTIQFELDHGDDRTSHSESKTSLRWPPELLHVLGEGYFVHYYAVITQQDGAFSLRIQANQP